MIRKEPKQTLIVKHMGRFGWNEISEYDLYVDEFGKIKPYLDLPLENGSDVRIEPHFVKGGKLRMHVEYE